MSEKEKWIEVVKSNSSDAVADIIMADVKRIREQQQEIKRIKKRLEEAQIGYLAVDKKNKELNNKIKDLEVLVECLYNNLSLNKEQEKLLDHILFGRDK